jgi:hypothetical protein
MLVGGQSVLAVVLAAAARPERTSAVMMEG